MSVIIVSEFLRLSLRGAKRRGNLIRLLHPAKAGFAMTLFYDDSFMPSTIASRALYGHRERSEAIQYKIRDFRAYLERNEVLSFHWVLVSHCERSEAI